MGNSFSTKKLRIEISLIDGTFDGSDNTVVLEGLRATVNIQKLGEPAKNQCNLRIYGMRQSDMNKLTTIPAKDRTATILHNTLVKVSAGDSNSSMHLVFVGNVMRAFASYQSMPNVMFQMSAMECHYWAVAPAEPRSYRGEADLNQIFKSIANNINYAYEDNGVKVTLKNPYLEGPEYLQLQQAADMAGVELSTFGVDNGVIYIADKNQGRSGYVPLINAANGLKEYPIFDREGIRFSCIYNPNIKLAGRVQVESAVDVANGSWLVHGLEHILESETPNGQWFTTVYALRLGMGAVN